MRQFFKFFFASLLALAIAGILFFIVLFGVIGTLTKSVKGVTKNSAQSQVIQNKSILVIDLGNSFQENKKESLMALLKQDETLTPGLYDVLQRIKTAKTDDKIKAIYLKAENNGNGIATSEQIRKALKDFKTSKKPIYAYGDMISQSAYYIASVADSVFINPLGTVELKGLVSQITFYKGALDKLEVQPEIFFAGKFKSATEPFRMKEMSDPNRQQIAALQNEVWDIYTQAFAEHAKTDTATINNWTQTGAIQTASDALNKKLVNGILYKDQLENLLKKRVGLDTDEDLRLVGISNYSATQDLNAEDASIAIITAEGEIVDQPTQNNYSGNPEIVADQLIRTIREVKDNDNIKSVVLRVNSPGGSVLASEKIWRELDLLKKEKPLVVSMGDLAASGGYYISCQADSIFALPGTITGSIGVFGMMFNTEKLFTNKLGITFDEVKNAPYADLGNSNRPMTETEKRFIQNGIDSVYLLFKEKVAKGRNKSVDYIDSIAQGRVWTGVMGKKLGLVDDLGDMDRALKSAAKLAKLKDYKVAIYPKIESSQWSQILSLLKNPNVKAKMMAQQALQSELGENYQLYQTLQRIQTSQNKVYMMLPFIPNFK